jgi:hypothetical protein
MLSIQSSRRRASGRLGETFDASALSFSRNPRQRLYNIFGVAKQEGWFFAVTYYAVRDPRYQRAEVCWSECVKKWKKAKPVRYPSFEEWQATAAQYDGTAHLTAEERKARSSAKLVHPNRLAEAVERYTDYEAIALWARPALERGPELPQEVARELRQRRPGYLDTLPKNKPTALQSSGQEWNDLNALDWRPLLPGYDAQVISGADEDNGGSRYVRNGQDGVRLFP